MIDSAKKLFALLMTALMIVSLVACSDGGGKSVSNDKEEYYIRINGEVVESGYIGYFFSLAQRNMLEEAGWRTGEDGNATQDDIDRYWETTKIDGKEAVNAARDLAADNVVRQKIQYYKAIEEGITLSDEEMADIEAQIEATIDNNGGKTEFAKALSEMNTDIESYTQIITENAYAQKLYDKLDSMDSFTPSPEEIDEFALANADKISQDDMYDALKKQKYNDMVTQWEKDFEIEINDSKMNEFKI